MILPLGTEGAPAEGARGDEGTWLGETWGRVVVSRRRISPLALVGVDPSANTTQFVRPYPASSLSWHWVTWLSWKLLGSLVSCVLSCRVSRVSADMYLGSLLLCALSCVWSTALCVSSVLSKIYSAPCISALVGRLYRSLVLWCWNHANTLVAAAHTTLDDQTDPSGLWSCQHLFVLLQKCDAFLSLLYWLVFCA